jgi:transcriptional regulator with XRE-family HTH domain
MVCSPAIVLDKLSKMLDKVSAMTDSLGSFLASARNAAGKSLRAVERETGISNAYLSQLETGKVKTPAPQHLHKLAETYNVPYPVLMELAGFPVPENLDAPPAAHRVAARIGSITPDEEEALVQYLQFIRSRKRER